MGKSAGRANASAERVLWPPRGRERRSSKGSDPSVYVLLYMFASYHLPPQQFHRAHASSYQQTTQSPSFHQPRHTLQTHSSPPPEPTAQQPPRKRIHPPPARGNNAQEFFAFYISISLFRLGNGSKDQDEAQHIQCRASLQKKLARNGCDIHCQLLHAVHICAQSHLPI